jgi:hypothetical protein
VDAERNDADDSARTSTAINPHNVGLDPTTKEVS